jgi:hypothetical protein
MRLLCAALLCCCASTFAAAATAPREYDEDDLPAKAWVEREASLPPYPQPAGLVEFSVSGATRNRFFIDVDTLSSGADGVVRYTLVVRSPGGAENVSFEGIRCETREVKYYAFGQRNGTWSRTRDAQWRYIEYQGANSQHAVLFREILCPEGARPPAAPQIVRRLRYGGPPRNAD